MKKYRTKARPEPNNEIWEKSLFGKKYVAERPQYHMKRYDQDVMKRGFKKESIMIYGKEINVRFDNKGIWWADERLGSKKLIEYYLKHPYKYISIISKKISTVKRIIKTLKEIEYHNDNLHKRDVKEDFIKIDKCVEDFYSFHFTTFIIYDDIVYRFKKLLDKYLDNEISNEYMSEFLRAEITKEAISKGIIRESKNRNNKNLLYSEAKPTIFYREPKLFFDYKMDNKVLEIMRKNGVEKKFLSYRLIVPIAVQISEEAQYIESHMLLPMLRIIMGRIKNIIRENPQHLTRKEIISKLSQRKIILKGLGVSNGKCVGKVKIIKDSKDYNKFEEGDILVTHLTDPTMISIMNNASGIICEIGGLTSHPSIMSRELGIPCVVGTKNATSVLKDGDIVEIIGDEGIIIRR